jgi:hypothetical protein
MTAPLQAQYAKQLCVPNVTRRARPLETAVHYELIRKIREIFFAASLLL